MQKMLDLKERIFARKRRRMGHPAGVLDLGKRSSTLSTNWPSAAEPFKWVHVEKVHERAVVERRCGEGEQEKHDTNDAEDEAATLQPGFEWDVRVSHGGNHEEQAPEDPAHPEDRSGNEQRERKADSENPVQAGRDGVENMSAIELAAGDQVKRSDEQTDPPGHQYRVRRNVVKQGNRGVPLHKESVEEADGKWFAAKADNGCGGVGRRVEAERKTHGHSHG